MIGTSEFLKAVTVKIFVKGDTNHLGTGFLYKHNSKCYVITCAHVLYTENEKIIAIETGLLAIENIEIETEYFSKKYTIKSGKLYTPFTRYTEHDDKIGDLYDIVAFEAFQNEIVDIPDYKLWNEECLIQTNLIFRGYPNGSVKIFSKDVLFEEISPQSKSFNIELHEYITNETGEAIEDIKGASGSGIFHEGKDYYTCLGVFKGLDDPEGKLGKAKGVSIKALDKNINDLKFSELSYNSVFTPDNDWAQKHVEKTLEGIGRRYITYAEEEYKDLNIHTPTREIFNYITDTSAFNLESWVKELTLKIKDSIKSLEPGLEKFETLISVPQIEAGNINYNKFLPYIDCLKELIQHLENLPSTKGEIFQNQEFKDIINQISDIQNAAQKIIDQYEGRKITDELLFFKSIGKNFPNNSYAQSLIQFFIEGKFDTSKAPININVNNQLTTAIFKHSLVTGQGLSGKTHILCDIAYCNIKDNKPTILIFGHTFDDKGNPITQIKNELGEEKLSEDEFLQGINQWGERKNQLVTLIIDAINETQNSDIWLDSYVEFVQKIKVYKYISLIISVRGLEREKVFNSETEAYITEEITEINHQGFKGQLDSVLPTFCEHFKIDIPKRNLNDEISSLLELPGILFLYFETLKAKNIRNVDKTKLQIDYIFNEFLNDKNVRFKKSCKPKITNKAHYVNLTSNIACEEMVINHFKETFKYDNIFLKVKSLHEDVLEFLISDELFLYDDKNSDKGEFFLKFIFQRVSNYYLSKLLIEKLEKENYDFSKAVSESPEINFLLSNYSKHKALLESLIIILDEKKDIDLISLFPDHKNYKGLISLQNNALLQAVSLPKAFEKKLLELNSAGLIEQLELFNILSKSLLNNNHTMRMSNSLHIKLIDETMSVRDTWWPQLINTIYSGYSSFSYQKNYIRSIHDGIFNETPINDEDLIEYGLTLSWFLCSTNRELRDKTTKVLIVLYLEKTEAFIQVLQAFKNVDDLYVLERLMAVGYGVVLRSKNKKGLKELCLFVYENIFNKTKIISHILLRDYARNIIEYGLFTLSDLNIDFAKIRPTYKSDMPSVPSDNEIETLIEKAPNQCSFIYSMQVEKKRDGSTNMYGDFGRYIFQNNLAHFKDVNINDMMNIAINKVIDLGYDTDIHGLLDRTYVNHDRSASKNERIGKKYQWIAMHELLGSVSDNYQMRDRWNQDVDLEYTGPWQVDVRDIDPTILIPEIKSDDVNNKNIMTWWQPHNINFPEMEKEQLKEWLWSGKDIPDYKDLLVVNKPGSDEEWFVLSNFSMWNDKNAQSFRREFWYRVQTCIVPLNDIEKLKRNIHKTDRRDYHDLQRNPEYQFFLAEYPWHPNCGNTSIIDHIPFFDCEVILPFFEYNYEAEFDFSMDSSFRVNLPTPWVIEKMKLNLIGGKKIEFLNSKNKCAFFDPHIIEKGPSSALVEKVAFLEMLKQENKTIAWVIGGEKNAYNNNTDEWWGRQNLSGFYYWDGEKIEGDYWSFEEK